MQLPLVVAKRGVRTGIALPPCGSVWVSVSALLLKAKVHNVHVQCKQA